MTLRGEIPQDARLGAPDETVWLWFLAGEQIGFAANDLSARKFLSAAEWHRHDGLRVEADRTRFVAARILLRAMLARFAGPPAATWEFRTDKNGRPMVAEPEVQSGLRFSITHTNGLVACAVARDFDVGVDAEAHDRATEFLAVAERFFAPSEIDHLRDASPPDRPGVFFDQWTLKEAFVKALGQGLTAPLDQFAFDLGGPSPLVSFTGKMAERSEDWLFNLWRPTDRHSMAVAIRRPATDSVTIDLVSVTADALESL